METLKAIALRKSTRSYKPEQISEQELDTILEAGLVAPVAMGDHGSIHITAVQNPELLGKIVKAAAEFFSKPESNPLYGAPTLIIVSAKNTSTPAREYGNASCVIENMSLASTDIGVGNVYIMGAMAALAYHPDLVEALQLPEGFVPVAALAVGYATTDLWVEKENKETFTMNKIQ